MPAKVVVLSDFRRDFDRGHEWKPADVVRMLAERPDAYLWIGSFSGWRPDLVLKHIDGSGGSGKPMCARAAGS